MKSTAIIIVNWNGWKDTVECLESFDWPLTDADIYIVDNKSTDDSVKQLENWLGSHSPGYIACTPAQLDIHADAPAPVTLVLNTANQGFAGGNNVILRYLLRSGHYRYAWLLNNDTVVKKDSLQHLQEYLQKNDTFAFAGSVLLDYAYPEQIQCCGVRYYKYLGVSKLYMKDRIWKEVAELPPSLPHPTDYFQIGASLLVDLARLPEIGFMDEAYFMYSEEADWQIRARKMGYCNGLSWKSVIYHKGTVSTKGRKHLFFYHYNRSAIILARKNFGRVAALTASFALTAITMLRTKFRLKESLYGLKGILSGWQAAR
ncbi:MAG: glycosyltransferase family 2 protein [Chitinophagaceae bacterium]|nr:glycosyltransferase family 2 protein [Chitinophagaceae bacterium]